MGQRPVQGGGGYLPPFPLHRWPRHRHWASRSRSDARGQGQRRGLGGRGAVLEARPPTAGLPHLRRAPAAIGHPPTAVSPATAAADGLPPPVAREGEGLSRSQWTAPSRGPAGGRGGRAHGPTREARGPAALPPRTSPGDAPPPPAALLRAAKTELIGGVSFGGGDSVTGTCGPQAPSGPSSRPCPSPMPIGVGGVARGLRNATQPSVRQRGPPPPPPNPHLRQGSLRQPEPTATPTPSHGPHAGVRGRGAFIM